MYVILLSVNTLSDFMLTVIMLNAILQYVIMLIVTPISVLMLNVSMLCHYAECRYY